MGALCRGASAIGDRSTPGFCRCARSGALIGCSPRCGGEYNRQRGGLPRGIGRAGAQQRNGRNASANRVAGESEDSHDFGKSSLGNDYLLVQPSAELEKRRKNLHLLTKVAFNRTDFERGGFYFFVRPMRHGKIPNREPWNNDFSDAAFGGKRKRGTNSTRNHGTHPTKAGFASWPFGQ